MGLSTPERQHAIVMGASIAGLLAARALSPHFERVTVLDRDVPPASPTPRAGVPQGKHVHVLLPGGVAALDRLFPGRIAELVQNGSQPFDYGQSRFYLIGNWTPRIHTGLYSLAQSRPFLEHYIRRWTSELPNVRIFYNTSVSAPLWDEARSRVNGVVLKRITNGQAEELRGNLVIDATGRNTRLPCWLTENGYPPVRETNIGIGLGYATGCFRIPDRLRPDHPILYIVGPPPHETRAGVITLVEDGVAHGAMGGYGGDHPPADLPGFLEFARSLSQPEVYKILSQSELLSPIVRYGIPHAKRRWYSSLPRFPNGLLPLGDSICHFDPAFAQGMTVVAQEAEALADTLRPHPASNEALRRDYFKRVDSLIDVAWHLSTGENFKYPQTTGRRPFLFPVARRYKDRVATCGDPGVIQDFYRVLALTAPPKILLRPRVVARTLGLRITL